MDYNKESKKVFETMTELLGLETSVNKQDENNGKIILNVATTQPGRLIGRNGHALNNLSMLMNRMLRRKDENFPSIIVDVESDGKKPPREKKPRKDRRDNKKSENSAPVKDSAPVKETAAAPVKEAPAKDSAPVKETAAAPVKEAPVKDSAPVKETAAAPAKEAPVKDSAPVKETAAAPVKEAPVKDSAPVKEAVATPAKEAPVKDSAPVKEAPKKEKRAVSKLEMQCRNAVKEVKRWGDDALLPPMSEAECFKALDIFKADKEVVAVIDEKNHGNRKRVRISLKND